LPDKALDFYSDINALFTVICWW